ncbi:MAG TPA: winged helix DNA-binding domain-containing protein [Candidatus Limnocylindrales bacterium]|nr:winged helix DNA-binding domain-containing protein [Candidatus Limnocylindrales bacterium]
MSRRGTAPVLSTRQLGRATLARQLLLQPSSLDVVAAVEAVAGLQAQEPASPYIALWARLAGFDGRDLDRALADRRLVKGTLMRSTVHVVSAADVRALRAATLPPLEGARRADRRDPPNDAFLAQIRAATAAFATEPRSLSELRDHIGDRDGRAADELLWWVRRQHPLIHAPANVPWSFGRRPALVDADAWLPEGEWPPPVAAMELLVRRYLAAFGPASMADIGRWAGVAVARVRPGVEAVERAGDIRRFRSEEGRELVDLVDAPLPEEDVPAPPRLLPMWDSLVLAFDDRRRVISDEDRRRVVAPNGDTLPVFLVDGSVAGRWWTVVEDGTTRIELEPFRRLAARDRQALEELADRLARFVEPHEPDVYARYRRWRKLEA